MVAPTCGTLCHSKFNPVPFSCIRVRLWPLSHLAGSLSLCFGLAERLCSHQLLSAMWRGVGVSFLARFPFQQL